MVGWAWVWYGFVCGWSCWNFVLRCIFPLYLLQVIVHVHRGCVGVCVASASEA